VESQELVVRVGMREHQETSLPVLVQTVVKVVLEVLVVQHISADSPVITRASSLIR
jgi:hypothetical protein